MCKNMIIAFELILLLQDNEFHSGNVLAKQLRVSRVSVWKAVRYLLSLGLVIEAMRGRGYRLPHPVDLLDNAQIEAALNPSSRDIIPRIDILKVTTSTNDYIKAYQQRGLPERTVCIAETQTAGRGRNGRVWFSPFGANISMSLYWRLAVLDNNNGLSGLSLVVGLAVVKALESVGVQTSIKWPNDIYYQAKKLAGILIESRFDSASNSQDVFIGIGINVDHRYIQLQPGSIITQPIIDLKNINNNLPSRNRIAGEILNYLVLYLEKFQQKGFSGFLADWQIYDELYNKPVTVTREGLVLEGIAKGVNARGELLISHEGVLKAICMGEVSVRAS